MRAQFRVRDHHVNSAVVQDVTDFRGFEEIIDGHHDRVRVQNAKNARDKFRAVLQPQRHAVAGFHAELVSQMRGDLLGLVEQFGKGNFALAPENGGLCADAFARNLKTQRTGSSANVKSRAAFGKLPQAGDFA